jgi:hypothetical protein
MAGPTPPITNFQPGDPLNAEVARAPERGWPIAAVGFTGKLLGPIGLGYLVLIGASPVASIVICATNDVIWWIPFGRYIRDWCRAAVQGRR